MNPLSLLTKGRTFRGGKTAGTYKLPTRSLLPKFGSAKRPTLTHGPEAAGPKAEVLPATATQAPAPTPAPAPVPATPSAPPVNALPMGPSAAQKLFAKWTAYGKRVLGARVLERKAPVAPVPSVQTELKLDHVTVVRNDLTDEDVVVVAAKPAAAARKKEVPAPAPEKQPENVVTNP